MLDRSRQLLALDLTRIDVHHGLVGTGAVLVTAVIVMLFGLVGETAVFAALFVFAADRPGPARERLVGVTIVAVGGAIIAFLAVLAGIEHVWFAALLTFSVTATATVTSGLGANAAGRGLVLSLWAILALGFAGNADTALQLALAFLLGGIIAAALLWLESGGTSADSLEADVEGEARSIDEVVRSPLGWFAVLRGGAVAVGTVLGILWFPEHSVWPALTVLLVMRPKVGEAVATGVLRTFGTIAGVLVAEMAIALAGGSEVILFGAFVLFAFGTTALKNVNYWVFVLFLTAILILIQELVGANVGAAASQRITATILGASIALIGIAVGNQIMRRREHEQTAS